MANTAVKTGTTAVQTPTADNTQTVLRQLKEVAEVGQRLRGDPNDSFVRVSELVNAGVIKYVGGAISSAITKSSGGGGSGTVTSVATGTGLTGGPITVSGTIALANTAVTPGTYTDATVTVDAQGRITNATNGSGGATTTNITPDTHPTSANAMDDEFEGSVISAAWTQHTSSGSTITLALQNGAYHQTNNAAGNVVLLQPVPVAGPPYEFTIKTFPANVTSASSWSLGFYSSTSGKTLAVAVFTGDGNTYAQRGSLNSSTWAYTFVTNQAHNVYAALQLWQYLKIKNDGTNIIISVGTSGYPINFQQLYTETIAVYMGSVTHVFIGASIVGGNANACSVDWFRRTL